MKNTDVRLQAHQYKELILSLDDNLRGGISPVTGDRYVKTDENKKTLCIDAYNLYGWAMKR